jgi:TM2 domain-containing membrane protein YozV
MNCAVHSQTQAVAYCRTCGKALCEDCKRDVMGAIYCEPCIAARLQGAGAPGATMPGAVAPPPPQMSVPGAPNPVAAGLLGLIPGVGAMYNGQFTKALAHVVIFVLLIVAANSISDYFGILLGFFVIYMAFEAYKTAEAKRHGLPPPDPLGLDKMFGIQDPQPPVAAAPVQTTAAYSPAAYPPVTASSQPPLQVEPPPPPRDNAPIGAIVLIGLGVMFLLGNMGLFRMHHLWPLFLIGIGIWIAYKRTVQPGVGGPR